MSNVIIDTKKFEGLRTSVYTCSAGKKTIGYGHNLERSISKRIFLKLGIPHKDVLSGKRRIDTMEANRIFYMDMAVVESEIRDVFPSFDDQPKLVKDIMKDLMFNLGKTRLKMFKKAIAALEIKDYNTAANELIDSRWYKQVGFRARSIVNALKDLASSSQ